MDALCKSLASMRFLDSDDMFSSDSAGFSSRDRVGRGVDHPHRKSLAVCSSLGLIHRALADIRLAGRVLDDPSVRGVDDSLDVTLIKLRR